MSPHNKPRIKRKARAIRQMAKSKAFTTVSTRDTFAVHCSIYNRLLFATDNPFRRWVPYRVPQTVENRFRISRAKKPEFDVYPMKDIQVDIRQEGRNVVIGTTRTNNDGVCVIRGLKIRQAYKLEATCHRPRWHGLSKERITCRFLLDRIPYKEEETIEISVKVEYHVWSAETWSSLDDNQVLKGVIQGPTVLNREIPWRPTLLLDPLLINTTGLKVRYMSQQQGYLEPYFHTFKYSDGKKYQVEIDNYYLCLATCVTMVLKYYGIQTSVQGICEAAAKYLLDLHFKKRKVYGPEWELDTTVGNLVRNKKKQAPHMNLYLIGAAAKKMLDFAKVGRRTIFYGKGKKDPSGSGNIVTYSGGNLLKLCIGQGVPVILLDDLRGGIEHGRVCFGLIVKSDGKIDTVYAYDPNADDYTNIDAYGSKSRLGWMVLGRIMKPHEVSPSLLWSGGAAPVSRYHVTHPKM